MKSSLTKKQIQKANKVRYINELRKQGDVDYCVGRLLHFGFYFVFEAKYHFQQALEKYLKAIILRKLFCRKEDVEEFDTYLKKKKHQLVPLWNECKKLSPDEIFRDDTRAKYLAQEFDVQAVSERSRYPQKNFGGHPVSFTEGYIKIIDELIFGIRKLVLKRSVTPLREAIQKSRFWRFVFLNDTLEEDQKQLLIDCFNHNNHYFSDSSFKR